MTTLLCIRRGDITSRRKPAFGTNFLRGLLWWVSLLTIAWRLFQFEAD
jgi:hypothetical protein